MSIPFRSRLETCPVLVLAALLSVGPAGVQAQSSDAPATIRHSLETGSAERQQAVLRIIPEAGFRGPEAAVTIRALEAYIRRTADPERQVLALNAYGKLGPSAQRAVAFLPAYLESTHPEIQRAAASALHSTIAVSIVEFAKPGIVLIGDAEGAGGLIGPGLTEAWLESWRSDVSHRLIGDPSYVRFNDDCRLLLTLSGVALKSNDPVTLESGADGVYAIARTVSDFFANSEAREDGAPRIDPVEMRRRSDQLQGTFRALNTVAPALQKALESPRMEARFAAARAIESIANARRRTQGGPGKPEAQDPMRSGLMQLLPSLTSRLGDSAPDVRLAAAEAIEHLGWDARLQLSAIIDASRSGDLFVRWVMTRTLGRILSASTDGGTDRIVLALRDRVTDSDLDVVSAALSALQRGSTTSRAAVDVVLRRAQRGDPDVCIQAIRTLDVIDADRKKSVAGLIPVLRAESPRVRQTAAHFLGKSGKIARAAIPELSRLASDSDEEVRREAARAIVAIEKDL